MTVFGTSSQRIQCSHCHHNVSTRINTKCTTKTHLAALVLFVFLCWPCLVVPYCMKTCKRVDHYCPNCGAYLGTA